MQCPEKKTSDICISQVFCHFWWDKEIFFLDIGIWVSQLGPQHDKQDRLDTHTDTQSDFLGFLSKPII